MERRDQDWLDDNAADIRFLIHEKNAAHDALLRNPTSRSLHDCFFLYACDSAMQTKVDGEQLVGAVGGSDTELC